MHKINPVIFVESYAYALVKLIKKHESLDNDSSCDNVISNMKISDDSSNVFMQQTMFAKYFLKCSNINANDEVEMEKKNIH